MTRRTLRSRQLVQSGLDAGVQLSVLPDTGPAIHYARFGGDPGEAQ